MAIQLTFSNESLDARSPNVVVLQKNPASREISAVAWKVIRRIGNGKQHFFTFSRTLSIDTSDSFGNHKPRIRAMPGQSFELAETDAASVLRRAGPALSPLVIEVRNSLPIGSIDANVYRDGRLLATEQCLAPGRTAAFQFGPAIVIGAVTGVAQGQIIDQRCLTEFYAELSLLGVRRRADVLMTGGGYGPTATAYRFHLHNVQ